MSFPLPVLQFLGYIYFLSILLPLRQWVHITFFFPTPLIICLIVTLILLLTLATCSVLPYTSGGMTHACNNNTCQFYIALGMFST